MFVQEIALSLKSKQMGPFYLYLSLSPHTHTHTHRASERAREIEGERGDAGQPGPEVFGHYKRFSQMKVGLDWQRKDYKPEKMCRVGLPYVALLTWASLLSAHHTLKNPFLGCFILWIIQQTLHAAPPC